MARVKRGVPGRARRKKVLAMAAGYRGRASEVYSVALEKVEKALRYAYRDRRNKKRDFRSLWIQRINAGVRPHGMTYSQFQHGLKLAGISLDRKILSDLATREPESFKTIVEQVKAAIPAKAAV
ncbi:MAG: 50S ribosomal protein L20 [Alphaproteobacteria bacterium]|jgi:large subunit ribosomal protein L20|nr:50S ribosomal protein L20 [Alphaproteobacteria bacterium]